MEEANRILICTLPDDEFAARRKQVRYFVSQAKNIQPIPNGLRFTFLGDMQVAHSLVDFILFEARCCSAVSYELRSLPPHSHLVLELRAPGELLDALRALYLEGALDTATTSLALSSSRSNTKKLILACRIYASLGAVICSVICIGLPTVTASLAALGISFLRNDKVLLPIEVGSCAAFVWSFWKSYRKHRQVAPFIMACAAAFILLASMFLPNRLTLTLNLVACVGLTCAFIVDRRNHTSYECSHRSTAGQG